MGGGEKALVNLLHAFPPTEYKIDLLLFSKQGLFLEQLPSNICVIEPDCEYVNFSKSLPISLLSFLVRGKWKMFYNRLQYYFTLKGHSNKAVAEQFAWKFWSTSMPKLKGNYDVAIGFMEKSSIYYVVDKINAKKKLGWIHTTYSKSGLSAQFDFSYFQKLSSLVTISEECKNDLQTAFDNQIPVEVIENISSKRIVKAMGEESLDRIFDRSTIVTVARLSHEKGIDLAVKAASLLKFKGINFEWIIVGDGPQRDELIKLCEELQVTDVVRLIGVRSNPYAYMSRSNVYCQPSRYEGRSIAIDEAKLLGLPIVVTNYPTVNDQIQHMYNGYIVEIDEKEIAKGIGQLLENVTLQNQFRNALVDFEIDEQSVVEKINALIS